MAWIHFDSLLPSSSTLYPRHQIHASFAQCSGPFPIGILKWVSKFFHICSQEIILINYTQNFPRPRLGDAGKSTSRNRKNCCRKVVLSSRGIYLRRRSKIREIFVQKLRKKHFPVKFLAKISTFYQIHKNSRFRPRMQNFKLKFLNFLYLMEDIYQILISLNSSGIEVDFLQILEKCSSSSQKKIPSDETIFLKFLIVF